MERLGPLIRISAGLVLLTCVILIGLDLAGLLPVPADRMTEERMRICETLASQAAAAVQRDDFASVRATLRTAVHRNPDVLSAGLRTADGRLALKAGEHQKFWTPEDPDRSTATHVRVPLFRNGAAWGTIEVRFQSLASRGFLAALWHRPLVRLLLLVGTFGFVAYLLFMRRTLRHLDPSAVIPGRVQATLDVMAEGVVLLDQDEKIVLANQSFADFVGRSGAALFGVKASDLGWKTPNTREPARRLPWIDAVRNSEALTGVPLLLDTEERGSRIFVVNGSPILDGWGRAKGAIATFDDVTELELKRVELEEALAMLEESQEEIRVQNEELKVLALTDPLTGVANRRSFLERFEAEFGASKRRQGVLACVMADIDHFKQVNDVHGHVIGDEVIRRVAEALDSTLRASDAVGRYGGEEFCIFLSGANAEAAAAVAERLRSKIDTPGFARAPVTVSFGVSSNELGAGNLTELIDQADEALYVSKRTGRNRVTRWDQRDSG
jgi:diguanylate cyclase (GGDEF)-like protein/PAS domain S-box-containing protein